MNEEVAPNSLSEENDGETFYFPPVKTLVTRNMSLFLFDYHSIVDLFFFTVHLAHTADNVSLRASTALFEIASSEREKEKYERLMTNPGKVVKKLNEFASVNSRNLTVTTVDTFFWFISASIQSAMRKRPELVKSSENLRIEDNFKFRSRKEIINYLIDKKVNSLSYGGMSRIEKFIEESLGVSLFAKDEDRQLMQLFAEVRNIHVHNRGYVNRVFLSRVQNSVPFSFEEGSRAHLRFDDLVKLTKVCVKTALELDEEISKKFALKRKRFSTWKEEIIPATS